MLKAVLFDLDGTLLDTARDMGAAANVVITGLGLAALPDEVLACTTSDGATALLKAGIPPALLEQHGLETLRARMLGFYRQNLCRHTTPYAGVPELLDWLNQQNIPWGVVTNKPGALTEPLLAELALFARCGVTVSADTLPYKKPHPAPLLHAAQRLGVEAGHCVYVGDHRRDIEAGLAAGMATLAAGWGYVSAGEDPCRWQAQEVMDSVEALSCWLKRAFDPGC